MIDFHVHQPAAAAYGPAEYLGAMDELGVDVSVVFTYEGLLRPSAAANDSLAAWVAPAPARLVAFATVDPRDPGASAELERCVREHGMRGVKLHPWLCSCSTPALRPSLPVRPVERSFSQPWSSRPCSLPSPQPDRSSLQLELHLPWPAAVDPA